MPPCTIAAPFASVSPHCPSANSRCHSASSSGQTTLQGSAPSGATEYFTKVQHKHIQNQTFSLTGFSWQPPLQRCASDALSRLFSCLTTSFCTSIRGWHSPPLTLVQAGYSSSGPMLQSGLQLTSGTAYLLTSPAQPSFRLLPRESELSASSPPGLLPTTGLI